ncbi:Hypothetical_protein [Hexamita inflata]|uniref:Hypothetical_protein n=1 Tax=Hexamita inflata TaxID=28002 RepID=A0AA86U2E9_9EUKA|nr:Hypothetical protein HINF_LOCUS23297 [Hexamita inflata]
MFVNQGIQKYLTLKIYNCFVQKRKGKTRQSTDLLLLSYMKLLQQNIIGSNQMQPKINGSDLLWKTRILLYLKARWRSQQILCIRSKARKVSARIRNVGRYRFWALKTNDQ